jgi:hypothetical protein
MLSKHRITKSSPVFTLRLPESEHVMFRRFGGTHNGYPGMKRDEPRESCKPEVRALIARHFEADIRQITDTSHFVDDLGADWLDHL